jgi:hypothetical protein
MPYEKKMMMSPRSLFETLNIMSLRALFGISLCTFLVFFSCFNSSSLLAEELEPTSTVSENNTGNELITESSIEESPAQVMRTFNKKAEQETESDIVKLDDKDKQLVMFVLAIPLLCLLLATGALGIAMGIYGKPVFVAHMVCAGLSITLAIAHAVVGLVWFYPF